MSGFRCEVDVAVIGAGAAGIAAGRRLVAAQEPSVLVLEARERVGGRVWTVEKGGLPLDLGGKAAKLSLLTRSSNEFAANSPISWPARPLSRTHRRRAPEGRTM